MTARAGSWLAMAALAVMASGAVEAKEGQPYPWQMGLQPSASTIMDSIESFHDLLLWVIALISVFVLVLMIYVCVRFRASANPVPSRATHNTTIEVLWTVVPVLILVAIAIPSFRLLYFTDVTPQAEMTIKAIGRQWYWSYEYPDHGNFAFDALMTDAKDLKPGQPRLLQTDNHVVVPVNTNIRVLVTAADVLHAWAVPAFGVKKDGVPGRLNETWFRAKREGIFYGQCSELCGTNHGFMPITVEVVSKEAFARWAADAKKKFASADAPKLTVAAGLPAAN
jgi:cytochrome c oxidase subunit II